MQYTLQSEMGKFYPNVLLDIFKSEMFIVESFLILGTNVYGLSKFRVFMYVVLRVTRFCCIKMQESFLFCQTFLGNPRNPRSLKPRKH